MSISKTAAGIKDGQEVSLFTLDNGKGLNAEIYSMGGIIRSLKIAGRDVVLGREGFEDYLDNDGYLGALIGRVANRINHSRFILNGKEYTVGANDPQYTLHGGIVGFDKRVWQAEAVDSDEPALVLRLESPDGEEGFPGNLSVQVTYTLTSENALKICYEAVSDSDTVLNMTNHSYFNLDGHSSGKIYGQTLTLESDFYTPNSSALVPTGEVLTVKGTPFDYTSPVKIGDQILCEHPQAQIAGGGIDHNFAVRGSGFRKAAQLTSSDGSITMQTYTDLPGIQIYTANMLDEGSYKEGAAYGRHTAICFETQFFPNATEYSHFIQPILRAGEKFRSVTEYKFSVK